MKNIKNNPIYCAYNFRNFKWEIFNSPYENGDLDPIHHTFYSNIIGPFKTKDGAEYMRKYGDRTMTVEQAEKYVADEMFAKLNKSNESNNIKIVERFKCECCNC